MVQKLVSPNVLLISGKEFLSDLKKEEIDMRFSIMVKPKEETKPITRSLPVEVEKLVQQFKEIVGDGSPSILPPKRVISHQIEFIARASLSKKYFYKMIPDENKEISRQV